MRSYPSHTPYRPAFIAGTPAAPVALHSGDRLGLSDGKAAHFLGRSPSGATHVLCGGIVRAISLSEIAHVAG